MSRRHWIHAPRRQRASVTSSLTRTSIIYLYMSCAGQREVSASFRRDSRRGQGRVSTERALVSRVVYRRLLSSTSVQRFRTHTDCSITVGECRAIRPCARHLIYAASTGPPRWFPFVMHCTRIWQDGAVYQAARYWLTLYGVCTYVKPSSALHDASCLYMTNLYDPRRDAIR